MKKEYKYKYDRFTIGASFFPIRAEILLFGFGIELSTFESIKVQRVRVEALFAFHLVVLVDVTVLAQSVRVKFVM